MADDAEKVDMVDMRLLAYELARSSFACEGGDVTRGGSDVRLELEPRKAADEGAEAEAEAEADEAEGSAPRWDWDGAGAGAWDGDRTSAAMSASVALGRGFGRWPGRPRTTKPSKPSVMSSGRCDSAGGAWAVGAGAGAVMRVGRPPGGEGLRSQP